MQKTRISAFPTIKLAFLGVLIAALLVPVVIDDVFAAPPPPDTTSPKADITYSIDGTEYKKGTTITITATFDEKLTGGDRPEISFSGKYNNFGPFEMTKVGQLYTYDYKITINENDLVTVSLGKAHDNAGNIVESTPNSGATFRIYNIDKNVERPLPKIAQTSVFSNGGNDGGFGGILESLKSESRNIFIEDKITLRFDLENFSNYYVLNLYFGDFDSMDNMNNDYLTHIQFSYGKVKIHDNNEMFSDIQLTSTKFDDKHVVFLDMSANALYDSIDVGVYAWNDSGIYVKELNSDVFSIVPKVAPAELNSIEIEDLVLIKKQNTFGLVQMPTTSDENFIPFVNDFQSNFSFELDEYGFASNLNSKHDQWSKKQITDAEFVDFMYNIIKQKSLLIDEQNSELSTLMSWKIGMEMSVDSQNDDQMNPFIEDFYLNLLNLVN